MNAKWKLTRFIVVFFIVILSIAGCSQRMLDFTLVSSKNVTMEFEEGGRKGERVQGSHHVWLVLSTIPLGLPSLKEAIDRAIESAGPGYDALIDGVIYGEYSFFLLMSKRGYKVEGTAVKTTKLIAQLEQNGENVEAVMAKVLFHSSVGRDNIAAIETIGVTELAYEE